MSMSHEYHAKKSAEWRARNPERAKAIYARYRTAHKEKCLARTVAWKNANKEKVKVYNAVYATTHPENARVRNGRRRARKMSNGGNHTVSEWLTLFSKNGGRCAYCATSLGLREAEQDNKIPLSRGGSDDIANIAVSCGSCNRRKKDKTDAEFRSQL